MKEALHRLNLDGAVQIVSTSDAAAELVDQRTGFRVAIDEIDGDDELAAFLSEVGLLTGIDVAIARQRQHVFQQEAAWSERIQRVNELLDFAVDAVPFYRERRAVYARQLAQPRDLSALPILRRSDLKARMLDLCSDRLDFKAEVGSGRLELATTSGTTDERVQAFADSNLVRIPASYPELWDVAACVGAPRTAVLTSPFCMADRCMRQGSSFESRIVYEHTLFLPTPHDLFSITKPEIEKIAEELTRFAPALWLVNPVYCHWLGRQAKAMGVSLPRPDVIISSYQYLSAIQKRRLVEYFGVPVFNQYSATELGGCQIGLECRSGRLHVREDHCLMEIVGRDGLPTRSGLGTVVVTTLASEVMPLIRYSPGDLAEVDLSACDCSLREWPAFKLHGREREALWLDDEFTTTRQVDALMSEIGGVDFYSCRQLAERDLQVEVVPALDRTLDATALKALLSAAFPAARIQVLVVNRLEAAPSLKYPLTNGHGNPSWLRA